MRASPGGLPWGLRAKAVSSPKVRTIKWWKVFLKGHTPEHMYLYSKQCCPFPIRHTNRHFFQLLLEKGGELQWKSMRSAARRTTHHLASNTSTQPWPLICKTGLPASKGSSLPPLPPANGLAGAAALCTRTRALYSETIARAVPSGPFEASELLGPRWHITHLSISSTHST